ncbi:ankyrin repeat domain-containing protein [Cardinium endosymbiont of Culicoides punctatus]|uniref:ankyrin repeat domain-containing protein n=1 Tax=Cardinium endosymbiont of Culicoides punctatus TaxID=2304601 RepID=UPI00140532B7|nr:ankyrin repeat domain-containing protein [Cardinium endosymbiont of Culicoides punctatus]
MLSIEAVYGGHVKIVALLLNHRANPEGITTTKWSSFLSKLGSQKHKKSKNFIFP